MMKEINRDPHELFTSDAKQASRRYDGIVIAISLVIAAVLVYFLSEHFDTLLYNENPNLPHENTLIIAGSIIIFIPIGFLVGWIWIAITRTLVKVLYLNPVKAARDDKSNYLQVSGLVAKMLFSENLKDTFVQLEAPDMDYSCFFCALRFTRRFILSYLAIFYFTAYYILYLFPDHEESNIFLLILIFSSMFIALLLVGIYQPINMVTEHSRLMAMQKDGTMVRTSVDIFDTINSVLVAFGLIMGYHLLERELIFRNIVTDFVTLIVLYLIFSIIVLVIVAPALLPALLLYRNKHSELVNTFRKDLVDSGVEIAKVNRFASIDFIDKASVEKTEVKSVDSLEK